MIIRIMVLLEPIWQVHIYSFRFSHLLFMPPPPGWGGPPMMGGANPPTDISIYWEISYNSLDAFICKSVSPGASVTPGVRILSHPPVPEISVKWASFLPYKRIWVG